MPIVRAKPTVDPAAIPGVLKTPTAGIENFGGGAAASESFKAAGDNADLGLKMALEEKKKADAVNVLDATNKLSALDTSIQYDPINGAMTKKGRDAFGLPDQVNKAWTTGTAEIEKGLTNSDQRTAFAAAKASRWDSLNGNVQRHVAAEAEKYDDTVTENSISVEKDRATQNYLNTDIINNAIYNQREAIMAHAKRNGIDPEIAQKNADAAESKTNISVIDRMLTNDDYPSAAKFYEDRKKGITGDDAIAAEKALHAGLIKQEQTNAWDTVQTFQTPTGEIDRTKAIGYVEKLGIPDDQKTQVLSFVDSMSSVHDTALTQRKEESKRAVINNAVDAFNNGTPYTETVKLANNAIDPKDRMELAASITEIYNGKADSFDKWLEHQDQSTKFAWDDVKNLVDSKYSSTQKVTLDGSDQSVSARDVALNELKQQSVGKSADQIRQMARDKMKDVVTGPGAIWGMIWPNKQTAWKVDAAKRDLFSSEMAKIESDPAIGNQRVIQAKNYLGSIGVPATPANILKLVKTKSSEKK